MENPSTRTTFFDPELAELATFRHRSEIYMTHLKKLRKMIWIGTIIFLAIFWQLSQNGRYQALPNADGHALVLDTRTGATFDLKGVWIGSDNKAKPVKIYRLEMGFWPYFGFWKVKTQH